MKTVVLNQPGQLALIDTPAAPAPGPDEALVRVRRIGICGTDLHAFEGVQPFFSYPRILGHELAVEVVELGGPTGAGPQVGDVCTVEPYLNCGRCVACRRGKTNCCERLQTLGVHTDGGMRDAIVLPVAKLHRAPGLALDHLALVEPLTIGAHAVRRAALTPGEAALVIGAGPIGLATMQFACLDGARVIAMEINEQRAAFARKTIGIEHAIDPRDRPVEQLRELLNGELPITVFDATGSARSMMQAPQYLANGGTLVFVGLVQAQLSFDDPEMHRREVTLLRSRNATSADFARVIGDLDAGRVNLAPWITHRATPEAMIAEFGGWLKPETGVVKALIEWA